MKQSEWQQVEHILETVLELPQEQRSARVEELCAGNLSLRSEVLSLLAAHDSAGAFLAVKTQISSDPARKCSFVSKQLGPYRLLEPIGYGGMGTVYRAERADGQFRKEVAVKVVPTAVYSPELLRRFSGEQQILATLEHPNIARLLDAGVSNDGFSYLVMEYIEGTPITDYCRDRRLSLSERLRLFQRVCSSIHYAHQHLIVHRDIKPANILVSREGAPKLLDFGIAKLLDPWQNPARDSIQSIFNPMTPDYASPEQARGVALTTATDIYSLGVILYELVAGRRPYSVADKSSTDAIRTICEFEPEKPSTIVRNTIGKNAPRPQLAPASDVDAIVAKAMRKDPQQRYGSAQDLALDISRYLGGQAVLAHRGSFRYVIRKFVGRHRLAAASVLTFLILAVAGVSGVLWQARIALRERDRAAAAERSATQERDRALNAERTATEERDRALTAEAAANAERNRAISAEQQATRERNRSIAEKQRADAEAETAKAVNEFLQNDLLAQAGASAQARAGTKPDPDLKVRTALDRAAARVASKFEKQPLVEASIRETIGNTYSDLGLYTDAQQQLERALDLRRSVLGEEHLTTLATMSDLAGVYDKQGKFPQGEQLFLRTVEIERRLLGEKHPNTLRSMDDLGVLYRHEGKNLLAEPLYLKVLELRRSILGEEHPDTLISMNNLAVLYRDEGNYDQAELLLTKALEVKRRVLGEDHPSTILGMNTLATLYTSQGGYAQAELLFAKVLEVRRRILGERHPDTLRTMEFLARVQMYQSKFAVAEPLYVKALETQKQVLGEEHPDTLISMNNLAVLYAKEGKYAQAELLLAKSLDARRRAQGEENLETVLVKSNLGVVYRSEEKYATAEPILVQVLEARRRLLGQESPDTLLSMYNLGLLYLKLGKYAKAESLFTEVLEARRRLLGSENPLTSIVMASLGRLRLEQQKYAEAESLLREALDGQQKRNPDAWERYDSQSMLGAGLMAQWRFAEAEPLLKDGYQGLAARQAKIPWENRPAIEQARQKVIELYESWGRPEKAEAWRREHPSAPSATPQTQALSTEPLKRE